MNTAYGRLLIIGRDTARAAGSLTDYHRCLVKIEERAESLKRLNGRSLPLTIAINNVEIYLASAKRMLGAVLGELDKATAAVENERKRYTEERRNERANRS